MYQVILILDEEFNKEYYQSYVESDDTTLGNITTDTLPPYADVNKARSCYYDRGNWRYDVDKYNKIKKAIQDEIDERTWTVTDADKLQYLLSMINVVEVPEEDGVKLPAKEGFIWERKCIFNSETGIYTIAWVMVDDPNYIPPTPDENDGSDYTRPIIWESGMEVVEGLWYDVDDGIIWQAIKSGIPESAEDSEYFDIP